MKIINTFFKKFLSLNANHIGIKNKTCLIHNESPNNVQQIKNPKFLLFFSYIKIAIKPTSTARLSNWLWKPVIKIEIGFKKKKVAIKKECSLRNKKKINKSTKLKSRTTLILKGSNESKLKSGKESKKFNICIQTGA